MKFKFIAGLVLAAGCCNVALAQSVGVGTMSQGTMSYSSGSAIAKVITEKAKVQARVQPNSGESVLIPLINTGELDFGIANVLEAAEALHGEGVFKGRKATDLRIATVMFPLKTAIFVRKDSPIKTIADLKGKKVTYGFTAMGSLKSVVDSLLATGGLTGKDIRPVMVPNVARGADEFAAGNADGFFFAVGAAKVTEVDASVGGLRMLPINSDEKSVAAMRKIFPYGYALEVKPRPGLAGVAQATPSQAYDNLLLTNAKVSDDTVYKAVKAMAENRADLVASFAPFNEFNVDHMYKKDMPLQFHPGALRYYRERGLVK